MKIGLAISACVLILGLILTVILVPLSFSYVEYYEYGLMQRKSTSRVDTSKVYSRGRYNFGPDSRFIKYQADAHHVTLDELSVFSAGGSNESIGIDFEIDVDFTFLLIRDEVGLLHEELASSYEDIIISRARDAIKNDAIFVTFEEYFQARLAVEERFRAALQKRWDEPPSVHCKLDQFHLGHIEIPEDVAEKQLEARIQNERNDMESFLQQAQIERELTAVEVNTISLERAKILRTAEAEAGLIRARASTEANRIKAEARVNGTKTLFEAVGIDTQDQKTAFTYIRTLKNRDNLELDVSYLSSDSVLRTRAV